jgi:hypothetical protein
MGAQLFQDLTGIYYDDGGIWGFGKVVSPGGQNAEAIRARIQQLEKWVAVKPELQTEIDQLRAQLPGAR